MNIAEILEAIALPARSNKNGFYETEKLDKIDELVKGANTPYRKIAKTSNMVIYGQSKPVDGEYALLITSHADIVSDIKTPSSSLEDGYFHGTYDNLGTNAACVNLMLNHNMPTNVYFAFTDEEETGRCFGAADALRYVTEKSGVEPICIALDVTDEGYDNDRLFTIEGLHTKSEGFRERLLNSIKEAEGEEQSFEIVKLKKEDDCFMFSDSYVTNSLTVFDESIFYAKQGCNSCSICLPTEGYMHSDRGLDVKEPVMEGYSLSLAQLIYVITNTHPDLIEEIKKRKDDLVREAREIEFKKPSFSYTSTSLGSYSYADYDDNDDDYSWSYPSEQGKLLSAYIETEDEGIYEELEMRGLGYILDMFYSEACEAVSCYREDELDVFIDDMCHMYGLDSSSKAICDVLSQIFTETKEEEKGYDPDDPDYDDYD